MKKSLVKTLILSLVLNVLPTISFASESKESVAKLWENYETQIKATEVIKSEIHGASVLEKTLEALEKDQNEKKEEIRKLENIIATNKYTKNMSKEIKQLANLNLQLSILNKQSSELLYKSPYNETSLGGLHARIGSFKTELNIQTEINNKAKAQLVVADPRFSKFSEIYAKKQSLERELSEINSIEKKIEDLKQSYEQADGRDAGKFIGNLVLVIIEVTFIGNIYAEAVGVRAGRIAMMTAGALALGSVYIMVKSAVDSHDKPKLEEVLKNVQASLELKKSAYEIEYSKLSDLFDTYDAILFSDIK